MGITGLLPLVEDAMVDTNISDPAFRGKRVGIDTSIILYRGFYRAESVNSNDYLDYCCGVARLLRENGIIPLFVFDGRRVAAKAVIHAKRDAMKDKMRQELVKKEKELRSAGKTEDADETKRTISRSHDVNYSISAISRSFLYYLKKERIDFIVAPYEADAQLASLCNEKIIDMVLTEDSDLIVYNCPRVIFKLDSRGFCRYYDQRNLALSLGEDEETFDFTSFVDMCILSGCDYLPSLPGIGLVTAERLMKISQNRQLSLFEVLKEYSLGTLPISRVRCKDLADQEITDYLSKFEDARLTFKHQVVYSFVNKKIEHLNPLSEDIQTDLSFFGDIITSDEPKYFTWGNHPEYKSYSCELDYNPNKPGYPQDSIWSPRFQPIDNDIYMDPELIYRPQKDQTLIISRQITCECGRVLVRGSICDHLKHFHNDDRPYMCEICGVCVSNKNSLKVHKLSHGTEYSYHCWYEGCDAKFKTKTHLRSHTARHHARYHCVYEDCDNTFARPAHVRDHIYSFHCELQLYECKYDGCEEKFGTMMYLTRHHRIVHNPSDKFTCKLCGKYCESNLEFYRHSTTHTDEKPVRCNICQRRFKHEYNLKEHTKHAHTIDHNCNICGSKISTKFGSKQHICAIKNYNCCGKVFKYLPQLINHEKNSHEKLQCDNCGQFFWNVLRLRVHKYRCTRRWNCKKCRMYFQFNSAVTIAKHIKICTGVPLYIKCEFCNETCYSALDLNVHVDKYHSDRICPHCPQRFKNKVQIQLHCEMEHPDVKKFACCMCGTIELSLDAITCHLMSCTVNIDVYESKEMTEFRVKYDGEPISPSTATPIQEDQATVTNEKNSPLDLTRCTDTSTLAIAQLNLPQDVDLFDNISCPLCGYQSRSMDVMEWHQKECRKVIPESNVISIEQGKTPLATSTLTPRADPVAPAVNQPLLKQDKTPLFGFIPHAETLTPSVNQPVLKQDKTPLLGFIPRADPLAPAVNQPFLKQDVAPLDDIKCPCGFRSQSLDVMAWHKNGCTVKKIHHESKKKTSQKENRARVRSLAVKSMDVACPNCRRRFNSREEMKVHHNKMHSMDLRTPIDNKLTPEKKEIVLNVDKVDFWDVKY